MSGLKDPHGGELKNLYLDDAGVKQEKARARDLPSWDLNMRQVCDVEMLLNGAFSPLEGFLSEADYRRVLSDMRLTSGVLWPMPITLDVTEQFVEKRKVGDAIALRDSEGVLIATMEIGSIYRPDPDDVPDALVWRTVRDGLRALGEAVHRELERLSPVPAGVER